MARLPRRLANVIRGMAQGQRYSKGEAPYITARTIDDLAELGFRVCRGQAHPFASPTFYPVDLTQWKAQAKAVGVNCE